MQFQLLIKLNSRFDDFEKRLDKKLDLKFEKELKPIKKDLGYIKKTLKVAIARFDEVDIDHEKRLKRIEDNINFPETN